MQTNRYYIQLWDCPNPACRHQGILGPLNRCPKCAEPKSDVVKHYDPPKGKEIWVDDPTKLEIDIHKPDWICPYCSARNPSLRDSRFERCFNCDFYREDNLDGTHNDQPVFSDDNAPPAKRPSKAIPNHSSAWIWRSIAKGIFAGITIAALVGGGWWVLRPDPYVGVITDLNWRIEVPVEKQVIVSETGWSLSSNAIADSIQSETRQRGTQRVQVGTRTEMVSVSKQVQDGYESVSVTRYRSVPNGTYQDCHRSSMSNGYAQETCTTRTRYRDESYTTTEQRPRYKTITVQEPRTVPIYENQPVYATWYSWREWQWVFAQSLVASGDRTLPRNPPTLDLTAIASQHQVPVDRIRTLEPKETCEIQVATERTVRRDGQRRIEINPRSWPMTCEQWEQLHEGMRGQFRTTNTGEARVQKLLPALEP